MRTRLESAQCPSVIAPGAMVKINRSSRRRSALLVRPWLPVRSGEAHGEEKEPARVQGQGPRKDRSHARRLHGADHCRSHPDDPRLVWLFQACLSRDVSRAGWIHPPTTSGDPAPTGQTTGFWTMSRRSETLAQCLLRWTGSFHDDRSPNVSEPIPMRKPLTGEPCAGEPHARFGGRGGRTTGLPYPYRRTRDSGQVTGNAKGLVGREGCLQAGRLRYVWGVALIGEGVGIACG